MTSTTYKGYEIYIWRLETGALEYSIINEETRDQETQGICSKMFIEEEQFLKVLKASIDVMLGEKTKLEKFAEFMSNQSDEVIQDVTEYAEYLKWRH
jgi:hypothetical protein